MSIEAVNWALDIELSPTQKLLIIVLSNYADAQGICWPSLETLSKKTGLSRRSVITQIQSLEKLNALKKVGTTQYHTNIYRLNFNFTSERPSLPSERGSPPKDSPSEGASPPLVNVLHQGSERPSPALVNDVHPIHHITIIEPSVEPSKKHNGDFFPVVKVDIEKKFEEVWKRYPAKSKGSKTLACEKFKRIVEADESMLEKISTAITLQETERILKMRHAHFCPTWRHFSTWLNQEGWNDETNTNEEHWKNEATREYKKPVSEKRGPKPDNFASKEYVVPGQR
jgi:hypothetical protein